MFEPPNPGDEIVMLNPNDILFSLPTLCDPLPTVAPGLPSTAHLALHEDDWRQIELVPLANHDSLQLQLAELAAWKQANQVGAAWKNIFIRAEHATPFESVGFSTAQLPRLPASPLSLGGATVLGGFALSGGAGWSLYGQCKPDGHVLHLAVSPGASASEVFLSALSQIAGAGFLLVDWYAGTVVEATSPDSLADWARRFG